MALKMSKKFKMVPRCHDNQPKSPNGVKNVFTPAKISPVREIMQN